MIKSPPRIYNIYIYIYIILYIYIYINYTHTLATLWHVNIRTRTINDWMNVSNDKRIKRTLKERRTNDWSFSLSHTYTNLQSMCMCNLYIYSVKKITYISYYCNIFIYYWFYIFSVISLFILALSLHVYLFR